MMQHMGRPSVVLVAGTLLTLAFAGCQAPLQTERRTSSAKSQPTLFLEPNDYPAGLGLSVQEVLANHRFSVPPVVLREPDDSFWFVSERFESLHRFDRIHLHVASGGGVAASITAYQFGPSDWAILGKLFADFQPEADSIAAELTRELRREPRTTK